MVPAQKINGLQLVRLEMFERSGHAAMHFIHHRFEGFEQE
jgi:hypothetical protein